MSWFTVSSPGTESAPKATMARSTRGTTMAQQARVYTGLRIWDGVADRYRDDADAIRVENRTITAVGETSRLVAHAETHDLHGLTALPGLIDAHVHMVLDPDIRDPLEQTKADAAERRDAMARRAGEMV